MKPPRTRFVLADLMIMVAAIAMSVAMLRATVASTGGGYLRHTPAPHSHWHGTLGYELPFRFFFVLYNGVPQILVGSLCVIALTLRTRRASGLRLSHCPGFVLSLVAVTTSAWVVLVNFPALRWDGFDLAPWSLVVDNILPHAGFTVFGAWITLTIEGHWKPAGSWIDRTGYALGALLVVLLLLDHARLFLENVRLV